MSPEDQAKIIRHSPGMLVAKEVEDMLANSTKPLTPDDVEIAASLLSQAAQAATPVPRLVWKRFFKWLLPRVHPGLINIAAIAIAVCLPIIVYVNGRTLVDFLIAHGLFDLIDWIRATFSQYSK